MKTLKEIKKQIFEDAAYNTDDFYASVEATFLYKDDIDHCIVFIVAKVSNADGKPIEHIYLVYNLDKDSFVSGHDVANIAKNMTDIEGLDFSWETPDIGVIPQINKDQKHLDILIAQYVESRKFTDEEQMDYVETLSRVARYRKHPVQLVYKTLSDHIPGAPVKKPVAMPPSDDFAATSETQASSSSVSSNVVPQIQASNDVDDFEAELESVDHVPAPFSVSVPKPKHQRSRGGNASSFNPAGGMTINIPKSADDSLYTNVPKQPPATPPTP